MKILVLISLLITEEDKIDIFTCVEIQFLQEKLIYDINTNEIPGELSRKSMISSPVKKTCYYVAALTREIFFNIQREISYIRVAM